MASELKDKMNALTLKVKAFTLEVVRLTNRKAAATESSDDSTTLNGVLPASMKTSVDNAITTHNNSKANPHQVTPAILLGASETSFNTLVAASLGQGVLPCSQFGNLTTAALPVTRAGFILNIGAGIPFMCWGKTVLMPAFSFTAEPSSTYYVYANLLSGVGSYTVSDVVLAESYTRIYVGQIVSNASQIATLGITRVSMLGAARVSAVGIGSGIPASTGNPGSTGALAASWKT